MIRLTAMLRRNPALSAADFHAHWRDVHAAKILSAYNSRIQARTDEAQTLVLSAVLCAGAAVLCYLFSGR